MQFRKRIATLHDEIGKTIVGNDEVVDGVLTCMLAGGHALLEGVPGLGKTMLVRTLAEALEPPVLAHPVHARPDAGRHPRHDGHRRDARRAARSFEFRKGPIFANIVLADEINRATPKTQSALLEAMQEHRVTVGKTHATCSTSRSSSSRRRTRSRWKARIRCPRRSSIASSSSSTSRSRTARSSTRSSIARPARRAPSVDAGARPRRHPRACRSSCASVPVARHVQDYAVRVAPGDAPRRPGRARPRASASSASAPRRAARRRCSSPPRSARSSRGASPRSIDDVRAVALPALRHRVLLNFEGEAEGMKTDQVIEAILKALPETKTGRGRRPQVGRCSTLFGRPRRRSSRRSRRRERRRSLRRRVPAQARLPRARQPARLRRAHARRAAHEEERHRRRVRRPPRLPAGRRLPLPRLERLPALRSAAPPPLRGGGGPLHLLHRRRVGVDGLRRRARSSATPSASRGARLRRPREPRPREHRRRRPTRCCERMPPTRGKARIFKVFRFLRELEARRAHQPRRRAEDVRRPAQAPRPRRARSAISTIPPASSAASTCSATTSSIPSSSTSSTRSEAKPEARGRRAPLRLRDRRRARGHRHREGARALRRRPTTSTSPRSSASAPTQQVPYIRADVERPLRRADPARLPPRRVPPVARCILAGLPLATLARDLRRSPARSCVGALHPQAAPARRSPCRSRSSGSGSSATRRRRASSRS